MTEHDELSGPELSPTLAESARRRADLHEALVEVEVAISSAAVGREPEWAKSVLLKLQELGHSLDEHIEITERPQGLYDEIKMRTPHLATKVDRMREEHPVLRERTAELLTRLQDEGIGDSWPLEEARDDLQRLLGQIVRHRQLGSDLVWEAYNLDIGGIE